MTADDGTQSSHDRTRAVVSALQDYSVSDRNVRDAIDAQLRRLDEREAEVLRLRFGHDGEGLRNLGQVSEALGMTWEEARRVESRAIAKLRHPHTVWPNPVALSWRADAEVLLHHLATLEGHLEILRVERDLARDELRQARARLKYLEGHVKDLQSMLRRELYEGDGEPSRRRVGYLGALALAVVTGVVGGVGQSATGHALEAMRDVETSAVVVIENCGDAAPPVPKGTRTDG